MILTRLTGTVCCLFTTLVLNAVEPSIAPWQGNRAGAFALTFDDGQREQAGLAGPMLDALGLKATIVINPGKTASKEDGFYGTWDQWRALSKNGHEIGNHSMTHPNFAKIEAAVEATVLDQEIIAAKALIEKEIGQPCYTFCYPFNQESEVSRAMVQRTHVVWTDRTRKAYGGPQFTTEKANAWVDEAITKKSLIIAMIHGVDTGYLPFAGRKILQDHLTYLASKSDQVWIAPLGTIGRYITERNRAKVTVIKSTNNMMEFTLTSELDPTIYQVPLTIVITSGVAKSVTAKSNNNHSLSARIQGSVIHCDIIPGPHVVTITWE